MAFQTIRRTVRIPLRKPKGGVEPSQIHHFNIAKMGTQVFDCIDPLLPIKHVHSRP
jgi:hypothetical protein